MKVIVLGSGVIGVTSAWYLAEAGHEVVVLDRQPGPALETSFANAGEISPGYASPWAGPGMPLKALKWLFMRHSPLFIRPSLSPSMLRFAMAMLRNCTAESYAVNKSRMVPLAEYSRDMLRALRAETGLAYDERMQGTLQLFRSEKLLAGSAKDVAVLKGLGVAHEILDAGGCVQAEPALARVREKFVGGLRLPSDETGDCFKFTNALRDLAAARGVEFRYGTSIVGLIVLDVTQN
jgi:D-amino-acid dehydrogenase